MSNRWTIKQINETDDLTFAMCILSERREMLNQEAPLAKKLRSAYHTLDSLRNRRSIMAEKKAAMTKEIISDWECSITSDWECSECEVSVGEGDTYCPNCGARFINEPFVYATKKSTISREVNLNRKCSACEARVNDSDTYCSNCGAKFVDAK